MAENSRKNTDGELKNHARNSSPSFDPRGNQKKNLNKNPVAQAKKKLMTEGIKKGAQAYGIPEVATEQILNTDTGQEALDAAASASSVSEGAREAVKVIAQRQIYPKILIGVLGPFLIILLFLVLIFGKNSFGGFGDSADVYAELREEITDVTGAYRFRAPIDGNLILATLVAYNDMEDVDSREIDAKNMAYMKKQVKDLAKYQIMTTSHCDYDSTTMRNIASNDVFDEENYKCLSDPNAITSYSLSIEEGNYDDENSGSVYYWNLIDEGFIFTYYNDYMVDDDPNSVENQEKIRDIVSEIYDYYNMMDKLNYNVYGSLCSKGITVDGETMNFEDYIKGVLKAELGYYGVPLETFKALAVAARSYALVATDNCTIEISNSTKQQTYKEYNPGLDNPVIEQAVNETAGEVLTLNGDIFQSSYSTFPRLGNSNCVTTCDSDSCSAELFYDWNKTLGSHTIEIPRNIGFPSSDVYDYATGLGNDIYGHCIGLSQIGAWYDANNGMAYEEILAKYYTDQVKITKVGGEGLVDDGTGYLLRVSRPTRANAFYYSQDNNNYGAAYTLEGECAWYATGRAKEILTTLNIGETWTYNGNGGTYCDAVNFDRDKFVVSKDYTKPLPGSIVSWKTGSYGHVAVVESVNGDQVTLSEGALSFGPYAMYGCFGSSDEKRACLKDYFGTNLTGENRKEFCERDGSGCFRTKTINISEMKYYSGTFQCYIYLTQPK